MKKELGALVLAGLVGMPNIAHASTTFIPQITGVVEELDETPEYLPLSDLDNVREWKLSLTMSDEFEGDTLDPDKWYDYHPFWVGRSPSSFHSENVRVEDGKLVLSSTYETDLTPTMIAANTRSGSDDFHTYAASAVVSKNKTGYGYYEVMTRTAPIGISSSFWFRDPLVAKREIDVYEQVGRPESSNKLQADGSSLHANTHRFDTGTNVSTPFQLETGIDLTAEYHVYGLEWDEHFIRMYFNGLLMWEQPNDEQEIYEPLYAIFDMETALFDINVHPEEDKFYTYITEDGEERFTGDFHIEYFRVWRSDVPQDTTPQEIEITNAPHPLKTVEIGYGSPAMDTIDTIWDDVVAITDFHDKSDNVIASAQMKVLWDEEFLYIYTHIVDEEVYLADYISTQSDCTELYINATNERGNDSYIDTDYCVKIFTDGTIVATDNTPAETEGVAIITDDGYITIYKIPHTYYEAVDGTVIGFDMQINDASEEAGGRHSILGWNDTTNNAWRSLDTVGELVFIK